MVRTSTLILTCAALLLFAGCGGNGSPANVSGGPVVTSIEPASGGMLGGNRVVIRGSDLANSQAGVFQVLIGGQPATQVTVVSNTEVECTSPPGPQGSVDVDLVNNQGEATVPAGYTYHQPPTVSLVTPDVGSRDGGTPVTVTGTGFTANDPGVTVCLVADKELVNMEVVNDTTITGLTPSSWVENARNVTVRNHNGTGTLSAGFTYVGPAPIATSIDPVQGKQSGGYKVTITGEWFTATGGDIYVRFGSDSFLATRIDDGTNTMIEIDPLPALSANGPLEVTVTNNNGESTPPLPFLSLGNPILSSIVDNSGGIGGGEAVTITGQNFEFPGAGVTNLTIGGVPLLNLSIDSDTVITGNVPGGTAFGAVDVDISNDIGDDSLANGYTYENPAYWDPNFGTNLGLSDDQEATVPFVGFTFPYYGTSYAQCTVSDNGDIQFGGYWNNYGSIVTQYPQILFFGEDLNCGNATDGAYAKQETDRLIFTWSGVPWWSNDPSITVQTHLLDNGVICMMYSSLMNWSDTFEYCRIGVNPGPGGTAAQSELTSLTAGYTGGLPGEYIVTRYKHPSGTSTTAIPWDLTETTLVWIPNGLGGYDMIFTPGVP